MKKELDKVEVDGDNDNDDFFFVPQLYLWGSPLLGELFAYVTVFCFFLRGGGGRGEGFNPTIKVATFRLRAGCVFVAGFHPSRT